MKIAVVGAGAMGCLYGAKLSAVESNQVTLLDVWQEHVDAINVSGLEMEEKGEILNYGQLMATSNPASVGPVDLAIIFVKSTLTAAAMPQNAAPLCYRRKNAPRARWQLQAPPPSPPA